MSDVNFFLNQPSEWLRASGPVADIVVSSRIRLARNLADYAYTQKLTPGQQDALIADVEKAIQSSETIKAAKYYRYRKLSELDRQFLLERHLISREHATEEGAKAVAITSNEVFSLMVLEEDHLRLQVFQSGFNLAEAWRIISKVDDEIEKNIQYAFSATLGYLTACPTNVGTGLRASCMLHLPGLVLTKQVQKVLQALSKLNLAVRGLYGEGTQATGNLFQFSNQITLGQREEEIIDNLECVIKQVVEHEKEARKFLFSKRRGKFEDQFWRALGALKAARMISSQEATQLVSIVQLGCHQGMLEDKLSLPEINSLFLLIQPAHLQKIAAKELSSEERDIRRAQLIRDKLKQIVL